MRTKGAHSVHFHESDEEIAEAVACLVLNGLRDNESAIVIAGPKRRSDVEQLLQKANVDVPEMVNSRRLILLDAADILKKFTIGGTVDPIRFREVVGGIIDQSLQISSHINAYGEMVGLLLEAGHSDATVLLEQLWCDLAKEKSFTLLCGYKADQFSRENDRTIFDKICAKHTHVSIAHDCSEREAAESLKRTVIQLRQRERALENEIADKERTKIDLREAEQFRLMVENVKDYAIFMLDPQGRIVTWNEGARRIKGYSANEIIGKHFSHFYTALDKKRDHPNEELSIAASEGKYEEEGWRVKKDGNLFWASVVITAVRDAHGELKGFAKVTRDLTERRANEEMRLKHEREILIQDHLQKSEETFRTLAEAIPQMVWSTAPDGRLLYFNRRWEDYTGRTLSESNNEEMARDLHPEDCRMVLDAWAEARTTGAPFSKEYRLRRKDGVYRWFFGQALPVLDSDGNITQWFGTTTDIDERKRISETNQLLADASDIFSQSLNFEQTLQSLASIIVSRLADWCSISLVEPGKAPREAASAHPDPERLKMVKELFKDYPTDWNGATGTGAVIRTGKSQLYSEVSEELIAKVARDSRHLEILRSLNMCSAMFVPLVAHCKVLGAITFISTRPDRHYSHEDLMLAEELGRRAGIAVDNGLLYAESQRAILARDEFMSIASHELKTPLTSLKLQAQLRRRDIQKGKFAAFGPDKIQRLIADDERQINRLIALVEDMLDITRINTGKLSFRAERFDLCELVKESLGRISAQFESQGVSVACHAEIPAPGKWDRFRLEQVFVNLLTNALKYGAGKPIEVSVRSLNNRAQISVKDNGVGIDARDHARIFGQFERAAGRSITGLGLGLFISKSIVEAHGGAIRVDSAVGKGSTFTIDLPLVAPFATDRPVAEITL